MPDMGTKKKLTKVKGGESSSVAAAKDTKPFVASEESKAKAKKLRIFSILSWIVAIGLEVGAILMLKKVPIKKKKLGSGLSLLLFLFAFMACDCYAPFIYETS